jgi:protein TonB
MKWKKLYIMKTRPEISDQEIHAMMDFDKVLNEHRSVKKKGNLKWVAGGGLIILATLAGWYFLLPVDQPIVQPEPSKTVSPRQQTSIAKDSAQTTPKVPAGMKEEVKQEQKKPRIKAVPRSSDSSPAASPSTPPSPSYTEAEPLGGYPELYSYFQKELKYPVEAIQDSIEGIVSVSFVINKDGKPEQINILNSLGAPFDNEAIRVIEGMPGWRPASLNGSPVPARISMPLTFQINRKQP